MVDLLKKKKKKNNAERTKIKILNRKQNSFFGQLRFKRRHLLRVAKGQGAASMPPRSSSSRPAPTLAERIHNAVPYAIFFGLVYLMFGGSAVRKHAKLATTKIAARTLPPPPPRQPSSFRLPLCALPSSSSFGKASSTELGCPAVEVCGGAFYTNYLADELVQLDVNSHTPPPTGGWREGSEDEAIDSRPLPPVATAADCCQACRDHPECNVWVFCADKKYGCGECFPQVSGFDATQADKAAPASSRFGPHGGCTQDFGSFPFRTCSLKKAKDPRRPKPSSYDDFDSWISGAIGVEEEAKEEKKVEGRKEKPG